MTCPLCGQRKAKRACPALGQTICPVCCATKREGTIKCPKDCAHLVNARAHPPVVVRRQHDADVRSLVSGLGGLSEAQLELFFLTCSYFLRPVPPGTPAIVDGEVADAAAAAAATFETASRGVVYEHPADTVAGRRMAGELLNVLREAGRGGGSRYERDVAVVLRRIQQGATPPVGAPPGQRSYLDLMARVLRRDVEEVEPAGTPTLLLP
ncbi:MAG: hypothetical protein AB7O28_18965 [Vicinamibacterales bacterium]